MTIPRVLVLHAYSAENAGDGLLVDETLSLIKEALGEADITLLASRPDSFSHLGIEVLPTVPTLRGWDRRTRRALKSIDSYDLVVAVGGGYQRAGTTKEAIKTTLVQGPQLIAAAKRGTRTVYLPQSIGPIRFGLRRPLVRLLSRMASVMVRDDRSLVEVAGPTVERVPDLATQGVVASLRKHSIVDATPVISIRSVRGKVPPNIYQLADLLSPYDTYVQSTVGGNDDRPAAATLRPRREVPRSELMTSDGVSRVVVAVRLHAALMALAAGHYVVHLAYERKGFGAFGDLGLDNWVHSVNHFDPTLVHRQVHTLLTNAEARREYDERIAGATESIARARQEIVNTIQDVAGRGSA